MDKELAKFLSFWHYLNNDEQELLKQNATTQTYLKGMTMHQGSDDCLGIVLVRKGLLRTYMLSPDGRDITLYRLFAGDVCILSASCVLDAITFDVFIDVEEDSEIITISSALFQQLAKQNIYVEAFGYKMATNRFSDVMWIIQQILFMSIDKRLAIFLDEEIKNNKSLELKITHEQIAKYIATAREVVTRMLKYFSQEGIVELSRGKITIIDETKLKKLVLK
ncbi:Crp/Fnr family transcriptional regulator [Thomasclavelia sp.]